jgi:SOS-response transcriptional repressor LexA
MPNLTSKPGDPLTARQLEILGVIRAHVRDRGFPPSIREIGAITGITSPNGVVCHLRLLAKKGYIHRDAVRSRAIALLREPEDDRLRLLHLLALLVEPDGTIRLDPDEVATLRRAAGLEGG